jgi:hypothetical protein
MRSHRLKQEYEEALKDLRYELDRTKKELIEKDHTIWYKMNGRTELVLFSC